MIEELIISKTRAKILTLFFANPKKSFYVREISRKVEKNINSVRRELRKLENVGILKSRNEANLKYYSLNEEMPIYEELKSIFLKTSGISKELKENLRKLGKIESAFIYGSYAKGEEKLKSDIDLMIIGKVNQEKLSLLIRKLESKLSREINYVVFSKEEFEGRKLRKDPFIQNVLKEKKIKII
jgi:predicted nucleotidyltransferase